MAASCSSSNSNKKDGSNPLEPTEYEAYDLTNIELVYAKVYGKPLPDGGAMIEECDLYGDKNPWEIWKTFGGGKDGSMELYLFSTLKKINNSSEELVRTIGLGSWESHDMVLIMTTNGRVCAKHCLRFENSGTNHDNNGSWVLYEYRLLDPHFLQLPTASPPSPSVNFSYVLCKLVNNQGRNLVRNDKELQETTISGPFPPAKFINPAKNLQLREKGAEKKIKMVEGQETTADEDDDDDDDMDSGEESVNYYGGGKEDDDEDGEEGDSSNK